MYIFLIILIIFMIQIYLKKNNFKKRLLCIKGLY